MTTSLYAPARANIFAAGVILWRYRNGDLEVAVVHRPRYDDWSFPKGKIDPGEVPPVTAVREALEETGIACRLGRHVARVTYAVPGHRRLKRVDYWAAEPISGYFIANREVDRLVWRPVKNVRNELSYPVDRAVLRKFLKVPPDTSTTIIVRHGMAGRRSRYKGDDNARPLDKLGRQQAEAMVDVLRTFGVERIHSANLARCVQTVEPLAKELGVSIKLESALSDQAFAEDPAAAIERFGKLLGKSNVRVICSQGKIIPRVLDALAERDGISVPAARNRKGSIWVLSTRGGKLVSIDHLDSALAP